MGRKRRGKAGAAAKKGASSQEEQFKNYPHSFVFHRGEVGRKIQTLTRDLRRVMEPFTASSLKVRRKNILQDYVNVAGPLNVTHFIIFTKTNEGNYMKLVRLPHGPTLTFKVNEYSLNKDVISSMKRYSTERKQFLNHPLLVMNGFSGDGMHFKMMASMFQNMFPSINVNKVQLSMIRRCVMLNYNKEEGTIDYRHYNIKTVPVGMSRGVKKLIKARIPNMAKYEDVSDLLLKGADLSESEAELDGPHNEVVLPQAMGSRGSIKGAKSAIRLTEIGPRITLQLVKIEDGLCRGEVLYHSIIQKTNKEIKELQLKRHKKQKLKESRKRSQEENIEKKNQKKQEHKERSLAGMKRKAEKSGFEEVPEGQNNDTYENDLEPSSDDDADYFRQEVGEEPDTELFSKKSTNRKRPNSQSGRKFDPKRRKNMDGKPVIAERKSHKGKDKGPLTELQRIIQRKERKQKELTKKMGKNRKILHNRVPKARKR